jgi:hypothetical protein|tara:strand:- start:88 stop:291 length:204 start_codon:yes stop_codon:yes gene_type:complete
MDLNTKIINEINKNGWYWNEHNIVYGNFGDTNTFTFCIARDKCEASDIAKGLNILNSLEEEYKLKKI